MKLRAIFSTPIPDRHNIVVSNLRAEVAMPVASNPNAGQNMPIMRPTSSKLAGSRFLPPGDSHAPATESCPFVINCPWHLFRSTFFAGTSLEDYS